MDFFYDWCKEKPKIKKDNIIFINDYHIEYNGKKEWLCRKKESISAKKGEKDNDYQFLFNGMNTSKEQEKYFPNIYSKPVFSLHNYSSFKNNKNITSIKIKFPQTSDNSNSGSRINDTNYTSRKNIIKIK